MLLDKVTLLNVFLCSVKISHEDIVMTTSPAYSVIKTSAK